MNSALGTPIISPFLAVGLDAGQSVAFMASETGGTLPYTYNFIVFNSITNTILATQSSGVASFVFTSNTNLIGNTIKANVHSY